MGIGPFRSCYTNSEVQAPNPDPSNWVIKRSATYKYVTVLLVKYRGCTNFEGNKILVFKGYVKPQPKESLDPHFSNTEDSPIARFKPTEEGWNLANEFAVDLNHKLLFRVE